MAPIAFADLKAQYARLKPDIDHRIQRVLDHGRFIMGPEVEELETALASYVGVGHTVAVSSGTDALLVELLAQGIGPGDAVLVPAFTFTATAEVVILLGATPVFVDVDARRFTIDPDDLERCIRQIKADAQLRLRAVIAVDLFGLPADYEAIGQLCAAYDLYLIADAAQSFGARLGDRPVGGLAGVTAISFFPAKPLGCYGDGGALLTDDAERATCFRSIRAHGKGSKKYDIVRLGLNARLDTLQAAILLAKLPHLDAERAARERLARHYDEALGERAITPFRPAGAESAWAHYTLVVDTRDRLAETLREQGIPTAIYYPCPMHLQPAYARFGTGPGSLPVSEDLARRVISLPMHADLDDATADRICDAVLASLAD